MLLRTQQPAFLNSLDVPLTLTLLTLLPASPHADSTYYLLLDISFLNETWKTRPAEKKSLFPTIFLLKVNFFLLFITGDRWYCFSLPLLCLFFLLEMAY